jgi:hypothetical protein
VVVGFAERGREVKLLALDCRRGGKRRTVKYDGIGGFTIGGLNKKECEVPK